MEGLNLENENPEGDLEEGDPNNIEATGPRNLPEWQGYGRTKDFRDIGYGILDYDFPQNPHIDSGGTYYMGSLENTSLLFQNADVGYPNSRLCSNIGRTKYKDKMWKDTGGKTSYVCELCSEIRVFDSQYKLGQHIELVHQELALTRRRAGR